MWYIFFYSFASSTRALVPVSASLPATLANLPEPDLEITGVCPRARGQDCAVLGLPGLGSLGPSPTPLGLVWIGLRGLGLRALGLRALDRHGALARTRRPSTPLLRGFMLVLSACAGEPCMRAAHPGHPKVLGCALPGLSLVDVLDVHLPFAGHFHANCPLVVRVQEIGTALNTHLRMCSLAVSVDPGARLGTRSALCCR